MLDVIVASEGRPDVVQISGGEPTIHPQFFEILDAAKRRPIRSTGNTIDGVAPELQALLCCLPQVAALGLSYENIFRVIVM
ncbi:hypothetical protein OV203_47085 [Nannocystis sp. ILAH1]|nr:hypothetical protein [Nannocystis sp. ILAH1]MCY0994782.1 hypothetical protein [Nannocystis sp. ILAH1]